MKVSGKTKIFGVVGNPISHSQSPLLHNPWFESADFDGIYIPFLIAPSLFKGFICSLKKSNVNGLNVTVPFKQEAFEIADVLSPRARISESVNTLIFDQSGKILGDTTDGIGFLSDLEKKAPEVSLDKVVFFGAGGVCRILATALCQKGAKEIIFINRTKKRADDLASSFLEKFESVSFCAVQKESPQQKEHLLGATLIINGTSLGMLGTQTKLDVDFEGVSKKTVVYDTVYTPPETLFLQKAKQHHLLAINGVGMLEGQARAAWEMFVNPSLFFEGE